MKRGHDLLSEEDRDKALKEIISYFDSERGEEIGVVAAGSILDFFTQTVGGAIYNKAIEDAKKLGQKQAEGLDFELDLLRKQ